MGHARCLLGVTEKGRQARLAQAVIDNSLSVRALEEVVRRERTRPTESEDLPARIDRPRSAHLESLQRRFEEALRTKVVIREGRRKGSGRVVIEFYSLDDFDRIADALGVTLE
jgi:ParB family chromosome partitioning protein